MAVSLQQPPISNLVDQTMMMRTPTTPAAAAALEVVLDDFFWLLCHRYSLRLDVSVALVGGGVDHSY